MIHMQAFTYLRGIILCGTIGGSCGTPWVCSTLVENHWSIRCSSALPSSIKNLMISRLCRLVKHNTRTEQHNVHQRYNRVAVHPAPQWQSACSSCPPTPRPAVSLDHIIAPLLQHANIYMIKTPHLSLVLSR